MTGSFVAFSHWDASGPQLFFRTLEAPARLADHRCSKLLGELAQAAHVPGFPHADDRPDFDASSTTLK